jgi:hypothetical protein
MLTIAFEVNEIVEDIDTTGSQAEDKESYKRTLKGCEGKQLLCKNETNKKSQIFCPLPGSHRLNYCAKTSPHA